MRKTKLYLSNITREEIDLLEVRQFTGKIHVIDHEEQIPDAIRILKQFATIGFDTETKPSFKKGKINKVALLQLSARDEAFLFRLNKTGITGELITLFEDEEIIKTGVAIKDDLRKLRAVKDFYPAGFLELQDYSGYFNIESNGLKKLAAIVLGVKISKSQQLTDWEARNLTEAQKRYAATDAWACLEIYNALRSTD